MDDHFIDRTHKRLIRVDEFQHHGIMGQRWGVITRNVGVNYIPIGRRDSMLKNATTYNLDSWGKSPSTNVLYVTGYSGSGKSTLSTTLQGPRDSVIHIDSYFSNPYKTEVPAGEMRNPRFDSYLKQHLPDYVKMSWFKDQISFEDWVKVVSKFEQEIENFGRSEFGSGRKVICEGVQLLDDTIRPDKGFFRDKPMIIMKTGAIKSAYRSAKRDNMKITPLLITRDIPNYASWYKDMQNVRKIFN